MSLLLDAGALIAYERGGLLVVAALDECTRLGTPVRTTSGVTAQVWRDVRRQVELARLLRGVEEISIDPGLSRKIGDLLRSARTADIVDASLVAIAHDGDEVATSDPADIRHLASTSGKRLAILPV